MKTVYFFVVACLVFSCSDDDIEINNVRLNHYKQVAVGVAPTLVLLVQEGDQIGSDQWVYQYDGIAGFDYEWGYIYDLKIEKQTIANPPADGSSIEYILQEVVSKKAVVANTTFDIILKSLAMDITSSITTNAVNSNFELLYEKAVDCSSLCTEMELQLETEEELSGVFTHASIGAIVLQGLKSE